MKEIDEVVKGPMGISMEARAILDRMYKEYPGVDDPRFKHY